MLIERNYPLLLTIIVGSLVGRAAFMEYLPLMDPTEARYATVAQAMVATGDWLTPKIPTPEGSVAYLGKPPLHFWLTAISYSIFGVDEWSTRVPSLVGSIGILLMVYFFCRRYFGMVLAYNSSLVLLTSALFFFLIGASVTDVTLTAMTTGATILLFHFIHMKPLPLESDGHYSSSRVGSLPKLSSHHTIWLAAVFVAMGFLCKGPVAIVLSFLPVVLWSMMMWNFEWLKRIPWLSCAGIFILIAAPWFIMSERTNPGFIKYFFWNENVARYLVQDYGDRYGSGHRHFYGMSWLMLFASFCPWTIALVWQCGRLGWREIITMAKADETFLFVVCWAMSAGIFFTFVAQLHALYLLPSIPGLAIATAYLLDRARPSPHKSFRTKELVPITLGVALLLCTAGFFIVSSLMSVVLTLGTMIVAVFILRAFQPLRSALPSISVTTVALYLMLIAASKPYLEATFSTDLILEQLVALEDTSAQDSTVGVTTTNNYSPYWEAGASAEELGVKMTMQYVDPSTISAASQLPYILIRQKQMTTAIREAYATLQTTGGWVVLKKIKI